MKSGTKEISLVATLGALSAAARIPFAALPNVQPSTFLIIVSGYVFGPVVGLFVGFLTAIISNMVLGQGPWTIWQMAVWGLAGFSTGAIRKIGIKMGKVSFPFYCLTWGFLYGLLITVFYCASFNKSLTRAAFLLYWLRGLPFDFFHAGGNFVFAVAFGATSIAIMQKFKKRYYVEYIEHLESGD